MARSGDPLAALERELDQIDALRAQAAQAAPGELPGLLEFIPQLSPSFASPRHLGAVAGLFERARSGEPVRAVISVPPRHAKTETLLHGIAWFLATNPAYQVAYLSSTAALARKKSLRAKTLTQKAGVTLSKDSHSKSDWRTTTEQGGLWACGIGGQINGEGFNLVVVDDPHKGRSEAESPIIRDRVHDWLLGDAFPRLEPNSSIIVCHTRWHQDDLIGRLLERGWESVCLPAISEQGLPLWPERWSLEALSRIQAELGGPQGYDWVSLYMGQPQPDGAAIFQAPTFYDALPPLGAMRFGTGLDFGYSDGRGDYSSALVMGEHEGLHYILDVMRLQVEPRVFRSRVVSLCEQYNTVNVGSFIAPTERGGLEFLRDTGLQVTEYRSPGKLAQSLRVSAAWNSKKVLVPNPEKIPAPWLSKFLSEVLGFTGKGDRNDDQVDSLGGAFESLRTADIDWDFHDRLKGAWPQALTF